MMRNHFVILVPALLAAGCPRPAPEPTRTSGTVAGLAVEADAASIRIARADGTTLAVLRAEDVGFRHAEATHEMEYGMFNVQEYPDGDWAQAAAFGGFTEGNPAAFELRNGGGTAVARVTLAQGSGPGHVRVEVTSTQGNQNRARLALDCRPNEHFNGLGAQSWDVDHRGQRAPLWVSEQGVGKTADNTLPLVWQLTGRRHSTHFPIPGVVASRGVGFLLDTHAYAVADVCSTRAERLELEAWENTLRLHIYDGPTPLDVVKKLGDHLGRPRALAPWALAPWNDAIFGTDNVRAFGQYLRDNAIPSSAIWTEDWKGGDWDGVLYSLEEDWDLDTELYPAFPTLVDDLNAQGIQMLTYRNPFMYLSADVYPDALSGGHVMKRVDGTPYTFTGAKFTETGVLDLSTESDRAWVRTKVRDMLDLGARGWMADFAEWAPVDGAVVNSGEDPATAHNWYPVWWQQAHQEAIAEAGLQDDTVVFARSGHVGSQAVTQVVWAGDQRTDFQEDDGLPTVIPLGLGLAATGFPFFTHDIAGYQSSTNPPVDKELFFRWTTLGAFTLVMRTHHGTHARSNWNLTSDAESTAHWKTWASFHTRLYPYLRALVLEGARSSQPAWIPTGFLFPDDDAAWSLKDQFMLGKALMVAPVVRAGVQGRSVQLPAGRWASLLHADAVHTGPGNVFVDAPLADIPVLIRAGGLVPLTANTPLTLMNNVAGVPGLESTEGDRVLYVGLGADGSFTEESGATYALTGTGTTPPAEWRDADGNAARDVTGNGTVEGPGFALSLTGHPADRVTHVIFR